MTKKPFAFFDIDGTIFRSSLAIELQNRLVTHGIFPRKVDREIENAHIAWLDRKGTYEAFLDDVVATENILQGRQKTISNGSHALLLKKKKTVCIATRVISLIRSENHIYLLLFPVLPLRLYGSLMRFGNSMKSTGPCMK